jgi:SecD/SecF fusion protein
MPRATFSQIVNRSMSEVLTRSLVTSLSTLAPITALLLFGGETLQDFAFALLIGVLSGTYSSIFIAAPVLVHWKEREPVWRRRIRIVREDHGGVVPAYADVDLGGEGGETESDDRAARRERVAARRRAVGARAGRGARPSATTTRSLPPAAEVVPPDDGGDGQPDDPVEPEPVVEPQVQADEALAEAARGADGGSDGSDEPEPDGSGDGANGAAAAERRATRAKQQRNRAKRRKHGRR